MEQFSENNGQAVESQKTSLPQVVLPDVDATIKSVEITSEQIEANIDRLLAEEQAKPVVAATNLFDAIAYAKLSAGPQQVRSQEFDEATYGEADPYVNPAELKPVEASPSQVEQSQVEMNQSTNTASIAPANATAVTLEEILKKLPNYEPESRQPEIVGEAEQNFANTAAESVASEEPLGPTVEVVGSSENTLTTEEIGIEELPPVAWFAENVASTSSTKTDNNHDAPPAPAVPLAGVALDSGEPVFDVRDFVDSANREIAPIPGSCDADPEAFEIPIHNETETSQATPSSAADVFAGEPQQVFAAGEGDVIEINGHEGFDYIDLSCFDVDSASFSNNVINIDDQQGTSFEIRHQNVSHATFADGVEISLSSDPINN